MKGVARTAAVGLAMGLAGGGGEAPARAADWPMWGRTTARNMVSPETGLPADVDPGPLAGEFYDTSKGRNVKWVAKLGSQSYGNVSIAGGKVFLGTNNGAPRDPKFQGDYSMVMAFSEATGAFLWQLAVPKLGAGKVSDWEHLGICSSPLVEGERVFVVTNRGEVVALDPDGLADGNDGAFQDEAKYVAGPGKPPIPVGEKDGDILWRYDMREELGVFPHNITSSSVLVVGDRLYATTSNGVDWSHRNVPAPLAPSLVVLDKATGKLLGEESSGIGRRLLHSNWSSPAFGRAGGRDMVFFGAGDGFLYGFDPVPVEDAEGLRVLRELWRADLNPAHYRAKDGEPLLYPHRDGPSEVIATPVFEGGLVYVAIGQDPEHGPGKGALSAVDPSGSGDVTATKVAWRSEAIGRSLSTVAVSGERLYAADLEGEIYALDRKTGKPLWTHDTGSHVWASPLVADGKVFLGNEGGTFTVLADANEKALLHTAEFGSPIYASAVAANGALYVQTHGHLVAFERTKPAPPAAPPKSPEAPK